MTKIAWFVKEKETYKEAEMHHAGVYKKNENFLLSTQVWNNRWGVEDAEDIYTPMLTIRFDSFEDARLLSLCKVVVNNYYEPAVVVAGDTATVVLGERLSGKANDGDESSRQNQDHFYDLDITIETAGKDLKEHDLKRVYLNISPLM